MKLYRLIECNKDHPDGRMIRSTYFSKKAAQEAKKEIMDDYKKPYYFLCLPDSEETIHGPKHIKIVSFEVESED